MVGDVVGRGAVVVAEVVGGDSGRRRRLTLLLRWRRSCAMSCSRRRRGVIDFGDGDGVGVGIKGGSRGVFVGEVGIEVVVFGGASAELVGVVVVFGVVGVEVWLGGCGGGVDTL